MGIVQNAMFAGLGQGVSGLGPMLAREQELQDSQAARLALAQQQAQDKLDAQRERMATRADMNDQNNMTRAMIAEMRRGAGNGNPSGGISTIEPGSTGETAMMLKLGEGVDNGDVPAGRKVYNALTTGDRSAFESDLTSNYDAKDLQAGNATRGVSASDQRMLAAKAKVLQEISEEFAQGKNRKEITEGRLIEQKRGLIGGVIADPSLTPAEKAAVAEGKSLYDDGPSGITGKFSKTENPTARSRAATTKDSAMAGKESAEAGLASARTEQVGGDVKNADIDRANKHLESLVVKLGDQGTPLTAEAKTELKAQIEAAKARLKELQDRQAAKNGNAAPAPTAAPSARLGQFKVIRN